MKKYIPESCPFRHNLTPDESEFSEQACYRCEDRCITSSVAISKRALMEAAEQIIGPLSDMVSCIVDSIAETGSEVWNNLRPFLIGRNAPSFEDMKRRENHVRTWKRRGSKVGKSKEDR